MKEEWRERKVDGDVKRSGMKVMTRKVMGRGEGIDREWKGKMFVKGEKRD